MLVAAPVEEIIFRGYVMTATQSLGAGRVLQVVLSAVTYALAHPGGPVAVLFTLVLGAALALTYLAGNRSLVPTVLAHMLINLVIEPGLFLDVVGAGLPGSG